MQEEATPVHNFVYSPEMVEFVRAANAFCTFLEQLQGSEGREFMKVSLEHLSTVYSTFLFTGETEPVMESPAEPTVTEQEWSALFQRVSLILGPHNDILRMAREEEYDRSELVNHTISEDVADLYQELRDFIYSYSLGMEELMNDAAWELKVRFNEHWGAKLLRALQALHELYVSGVDPNEKE
ncbi:MAG: DUF5063 domain-containing protein [Bacteroidales bacterium]|nr:DUF5063 domain-containing protein [Bacteroidales bacterium]